VIARRSVGSGYSWEKRFTVELLAALERILFVDNSEAQLEVKNRWTLADVREIFASAVAESASGKRERLIIERLDSALSMEKRISAMTTRPSG
jgi:hypothetical protein